MIIESDDEDDDDEDEEEIPTGIPLQVSSSLSNVCVFRVRHLN